MAPTKQLLLLAGAAALPPLIWQQNNSIQLSQYSLRDRRIPSGFDGCRFLQISDLHNKEFGPGQRRLLEVTAAARPDYILITGDLIHDGRDFTHALEWVRRARGIAPIYFAPGNHEKGSRRYRELARRLEELGVCVLHSRGIVLERNGSALLLAGMADPRFYSLEPMGGLLCGFWGFERMDAVVNTAFETDLALLRQAHPGLYTVLLSHRPELLPLYARQGIELVFAGHAHGGQFRLPGIGGLASPAQGVFPAYTEGLCRMKRPGGGPGTVMAVSRGLGGSRLQLRLNNRTEVVLVTLQAR